MFRTACLLLAFALAARAAEPAPYLGFGNPQRVTIQGYDDVAMEPFITRDRQWLLFNNSNAPDAQTDLHAAERIDDVTYTYRGKLDGANSDALDAVATADRDGAFYFVSLRSYETTLTTIHQGRLSNGAVTDVALVQGISRQKPGLANFDVEISPDGTTMYFVEGWFNGGPNPAAADLVVATRTAAGFERSRRSAFLMKNINTSELEYAACISNDGLELFFTRWNPKNGRIGIYRAARPRTTLPFAPPRRVAAITGLVEAPALSPDERSLYYHKEENGRFVIYRVTR